jgi:hypothetical protein
VGVKSLFKVREAAIDEVYLRSKAAIGGRQPSLRATKFDIGAHNKHNTEIEDKGNVVNITTST